MKKDQVIAVARTQPTLTSPASPSLGAGRQLDDVDKAVLVNLLHDDPQCPSRLLLDKVAQHHVPLDISVRHLNRLRRVLHSYVAYYHTWRPHRSLEMDAPEPRAIHRPELGPARKLPEVGGLHHHYERIAA